MMYYNERAFGVNQGSSQLVAVYWLTIRCSWHISFLPENLYS